MEEHYLDKIRRNQNKFNETVDRMSEEDKTKIYLNITWAVEMVKRLDVLDYDVREKTIVEIHDLMDKDYERMMGLGKSL